MCVVCVCFSAALLLLSAHRPTSRSYPGLSRVGASLLLQRGVAALSAVAKYVCERV